MYTPKGYEEVSVPGSTGAPIGLNPPAGALRAEIYLSVAAVRYRDDGVAPAGNGTAGGIPFATTDAMPRTIYESSIAKIKFIGSSANAATIDVLYYG